MEIVITLQNMVLTTYYMVFWFLKNICYKKKLSCKYDENPYSLSELISKTIDSIWDFFFHVLVDEFAGDFWCFIEYMLMQMRRECRLKGHNYAFLGVAEWLVWPLKCY